MSFIVRLSAPGALAAAPPAHAEWLQATSRHFVVYLDTAEPAMRKQAIQLEQFDAMIRRFRRRPSPF